VESRENFEDETVRLTLEKAKAELQKINSLDQTKLTPEVLVTKAILLHFDKDPQGRPEEIEEVLEAALSLDSKYMEAYIELGYYLYSVDDNSFKAKEVFLRALKLLKEWNSEVLKGLLKCDEELFPQKDRKKLLEDY
jgi:tetratricopeptide (TPR) repeat protein